MENANTRQAPRIWLVLSDKAGDNAQVELIARHIGEPYLIKRVIPRKKYVFGKPGFKPSLYHLDLDKSDKITPPWPELIITVGRRSSMVALWIKEQSGHKTRIVLLGRPRRWIEKFDLILSPLQYHVPQRDNIHNLGLPLFEINQNRLENARTQWEKQFSPLKKPLIALFIGGPTRPFIMNRKTVIDLANKAIAVTRQSGGTLYISTSRRTPPAVTKALAQYMPPSTYIYEWGDTTRENPYMGLMAHADIFIVTGDSVSMLVETTKLGKPLLIYPLTPSRVGALWQRITFWLHPLHRRTWAEKFSGRLGDFLYRIGLIGFPRDLTLIHQYLIQNGLAAQLGNQPPRPSKTTVTDLSVVTKKIRLLLS